MSFPDVSLQCKVIDNGESMISCGFVKLASECLQQHHACQTLVDEVLANLSHTSIEQAELSQIGIAI